MGVITVEHEISCSLPASRLFKSFVLDVENLFPKILPHFFKSFKTIEGDGGVGSIKLVTFGEQRGEMKDAKHKIEEVDEEKMCFKYSLIEGGILGEDVESISYVYKFEEGKEGGCIIKIVETYPPKVEDDHMHTIHEKIEKSKQVTKGFINSVEAHLHANPHLYV